MAVINGTSVGGMTLQADYSYTQNTSANTSTVTVILKLVGHYALYSSALSGSYISVGGSRTDYSKTISYGGSTTTTTELTRKTVTVKHNSDGTATCNIAGTFVMNGTYRNSSVGTMSVNQTITLPKIARSSSFTVSSSVNTGSAISGTVTPSSTAFNHKLLLKIGSSTKATITMAVGTTTFSYTIPHSWFPTSTSGVITAVLETYNGTTLVATTSKNITANVPANIGPSISSFVVESVDGMNGLSIRGRSRVRLTANTTPGSGASSIATYTFYGNNVNEADGSASRIVYNPANSSVINTGVFSYTGPATYTVTVADTRGRTASASLGIEVFEYAPPVITAMSVQRCNADGALNENGTYAYVTVNSWYTTLYHNNTNYNTRTVVLTNGTNSFSATIQNTGNTSNSWSGVYGNGTFTTGSTHTITATIKDTAYGSSSSMSQPLKAAARPMNIKSNGKGIGFGKMAETDNLLDVGWDERVRGNLQVDGAINGVNMNLDNYILGGSRDNITNENWVENVPSFIGTYSEGSYWFSTLSVRHRNGREDGTKYGMQLRSILTQPDNLSWRQHINTTWGPWHTLLDTNNTPDRVIETGASEGWTWRKWHSGRMELYGTVSHNPTALNDNINSVTVTMPVWFVNSAFRVLLTPAKCGLLVTNFGDCASNNDITHTNNSFVLSYRYNHSQVYTVNFNVMVVGGWK
jgi:alpha-acetolactate decarboxylase